MHKIICFLFSFSVFLNASNFIELYEKGKYNEAIKKAENYSLKNKSNIADFFLGKIYLYGDHTKKDLFKAFYYLEKSSKNGNKNADFLLAKMYMNGIYVNKNEKKAIDILTKLSKQGNKNAQYILSYCFFNGIGVKKDYKKAFFWGRRSAFQKVPEANYIVGLMYYTGNGVKENIQKAISHLKLASLYGNLDAQELLARILIRRDKKQLKGKFSKETVDAVKVALRNGSTTLWTDWNNLELGLYDSDSNSTSEKIGVYKIKDGKVNLSALKGEASR